MRFCALTASATSLPSLISGSVVVGQLRAEVDPSGDDFGHRLGGALEGDVLRLDAGADAQPLAGEMRGGADAGRGVVQRAGLRLAGGDQIAERLVAFSGERDDHQRLDAERRSPARNH